MSRRKKGNKGKSSIMLLISFCDFISSAILDFIYFLYFCGTLKIKFLCFPCFDFNVDLRFCVTLLLHSKCNFDSSLFTLNS